MTTPIFLLLVVAAVVASSAASCSGSGGLTFLPPYENYTSIAYPYWSGSMNFSLGPLKVIYVPKENVSKACHSEDIKNFILASIGQEQVGQGYALLLGDMIADCYPEEAANAVYGTNINISVLLTVNSHKLLGTKPIILWKFNGAKIPIVEIQELDIFSSSVTDLEVCVIPSDNNPYDDWIVRGFLILLGALCMILAFWKLCLVLTRTNGRLPVSYVGEDCSLASHAATLILVFEGVSSVACMSHQGVDPWGFLHFLDYPFIRVVATLSELLPFFTFFIVGCVLQDAVVDVEQTAETKVKSIRGRAWKKLAWIEFAVGSLLLAVITTVELVNLAYDLLRSETIISSSSFAIWFCMPYSALAGIYYFIVKSRIIGFFRKMPVHLINKQFAREIEDMSNCLFLSGYCIFGYVIFMAMEIGLNGAHKFPFFAWSAAVACINGAGILQVCAIQRVNKTSKVKFREGDPSTIQGAVADEETEEHDQLLKIVPKPRPPVSHEI